MLFFVVFFEVLIFNVAIGRGRPNLCGWMALEKSDSSQKASSYTFQEGARLGYDGLQSAYKSTKDPRAFFCQPITIAFYASTVDNLRASNQAMHHKSHHFFLQITSWSARAYSPIVDG